MGMKTGIEWSDSTRNLEMGCDGCELWNAKTEVLTCYAGVMTRRYEGRNGWPDNFDIPKIFPHRANLPATWPDLTGKARPEKPWLNGYPRLIFEGDMGDYFSESLPDDWLAEYIPAMEKTRHVHQFLTKRPKRMVEFFNRYGRIPQNFWLGTSVTGPETLSRLKQLAEAKKINSHVILFASIEPLLSPVDLSNIFNIEMTASGYTKKVDWVGPLIDWILLGGESGSNRPTEVEWVHDLILQAHAGGAFPFVKQMGSVWAKENDARHSKGGNMDEWPREIRVRELPPYGNAGKRVGNEAWVEPLQKKFWSSTL